MSAESTEVAVLVRRFDPTGEELARWEPLARDDDGSIAFLSPAKAKAAALAPPSGAGLHIGDLIATMPAEAAGHDEYATGLYVVTPDGVKASPKPPGHLRGAWLARWGANAEEMLGEASESKADKRRLVMAACDCVETVLHLVPAGDDLPRAAIEAARAWCLGRMDLGQVKAASETVEPSKSGDVGTARGAAYGAAWSVSTACYDEDACTALVKCGAWCAAEAVRIADGTPHDAALRVFAPLVERWLPLAVVLLSGLGYDAIPFEPEPDASDASNTPVSTP